MADDLADLGEPVTDRTLVLNVICGLNENFTDIGRHLRRGRPFPTFLDVRNDLLLEEITAAQRNSAAPTALLATGAGGAASRSPAPRSSASTHEVAPRARGSLYFVRERVAVGDVRVMHVPTSSQYADIFTKGLPSSVFTEFRSSLNVRAADDPTAGAC